MSSEQSTSPPSNSDGSQRSAVKTTPLKLGAASQAKPGAKSAQGDQAWLKRTRDFYAEILAELDYDLSEEFSASLRALHQRLHQADEATKLIELGVKIRELTGRFAKLLFAQREDASALVAEVVSRLSEAEGHLRTSANQALEIHKAGENFSETMRSQIQDLGSSVQSGQGLEDLKLLVLERLSQFTDTVQVYRHTEASHLRSVSKELDQLRRQFQEAQAQLRRMERENRDLAAKVRIDPLTGAYNRVALEERLAEEVARFQRYQRPFCILLIDLDHFKRINDSYGHPVGDTCLREVVSRLKQRLRASDLLARYGGEEFVVVLPETSIKDAWLAAEQLRKAIAETEFTLRGKRLPLTVSVGLSQALAADQGYLPLLSRADEAMYAAKRGGRNQVAQS